MEMKHFKLLSLLFAAFLAAAAFVACGDDEDESTSGGDKGLVGAWIDEGGHEILVLNANGKGYWTSPRHLDKGEDDEDAFTWSASNSILTLKYAAEDYGYSYSEEEIDKYRYVLSGDKLTLSDVDGKNNDSGSGGFHEVYTRINLDDLKK
jgi:hypothetical protein